MLLKAEAEASLAASTSSITESSTGGAQAGQQSASIQSLLRLSAMPKVFMEASNIPSRKDIRHVRKASADAEHEVLFAVRHKNLDYTNQSTNKLT